MIIRIYLFYSFILLYSCSNSNIESNQTHHSTSEPIKIGYLVSEIPCGFDETVTDTSFVIDNSVVYVSFNIYCAGNYDVRDTFMGKDTGRISAHKNQYVRVLLNNQKEVNISKELFTDSLKDYSLKSLLLGSTAIDTFDIVNRRIVFSTFLGFPESDNGVLIDYSIDLNGKVNFIRTRENEMKD